MNINWDIIIKIIIPLVTLIIGKYFDRWLTKRPKLLSYLGHASVFTLHGEKPQVIHTHTVIVRNAGKETANNVRLGHYFLPENYHIFPSVPHDI